jgi:hypothetical protein
MGVTPEETEMALEGLRDFYTEGDDGKYRLDAEGVEDVGGLKSALEKERRDRKKYERTLKKYEGIDPEKWQALLEAEDEKEREAAKAAGDWEKREAQILEKHAKAISEKDGEISAAFKAVERYLVDAEATKAIAAAKGSPRLLLQEVKRQVRVVKTDDGGFAVKVVDADGNERIGTVADGKANPMTIAELVNELRADDELAAAFAGSGASGSGASTTEKKAGGGSVRAIAHGDNKAFIDNLADIAAGKTTVE